VVGPERRRKHPLPGCPVRLRIALRCTTPAEPPIA